MFQEKLINIKHVVVMGVAGCGKSSVGRLVADDLGWCFVEGDELHSTASVEKMRKGEALTDEDRSGWLARLADVLAGADRPLVLTCSALKSTYRNQLRAACPQLRFVYLQLSPAEAAVRVATRKDHLFPASLVASQFATLEEPIHEDGVLTLNGELPLEELVARAVAWIT